MSSASVDLTPQVTLSRCVPVSSTTSTQSPQHPQEAQQSQVGETSGNQRQQGQGRRLWLGRQMAMLWAQRQWWPATWARNMLRLLNLKALHLIHL